MSRQRVKVVSAAGTELLPGVIAADPAAAQPHFEQQGWMTNEPCPDLGGRLNPRIELDDGTVIWGWQCWFTYIESDESV